MGHQKTNRRGTTRAALGIGAIALFLLAFAPPAWATSEHSFDPVLSLNGSTTTSSEDEVPDPGSSHPPKAFEGPCGTATDPHGDIYVAIPGEFKSEAGRIDVFNPAGEYLLEVKDAHQPCTLAVDSKGNLYAREYEVKGKVVRYAPDSYPPSGSTHYGSPVSVYDPSEHGDPGSNLCLRSPSIAVNPANDHLYVSHDCRIEEYDSAAAGSALLNGKIGESLQNGNPVAKGFKGIDVYGKNHDVYVARKLPNEFEGPDMVAVYDGADGHVKCEVDGSKTPAGSFSFSLGAPVAVDQSNGDFYVLDTAHKVADQFSVKGEECKYVGQLPTPPVLKQQVTTDFGDIAVDDPLVKGEAGYDSPNEGYVYATSGTKAASSHLFAFAPIVKEASEPPEIRGQGASAIAETEAVLGAELDPHNHATSFRFEYTSEAEFLEHGYAGAAAVPVPDGDGGEGGAFVAVSEPIVGLEAGVSYRFRLVATSRCNPEEPEELCTASGEDARFATYPIPTVSSGCPNESLRTGPSAALPDCRAYELVTPPDTNGRTPTMSELGGTLSAIGGFDSQIVSPDGGGLVFGSEGGSLPGLGGGGYHDTYEALRGSSGWQSLFTGLSGAQANRALPGGISPDHTFSFWHVIGENGTLAVSGKNSEYIRRATGSADPNCAPATEPEGQFEYVGCGSEGTDPFARGRWIAPGGGHVVFTTGVEQGASSPPVQLELCAPPSPVGAIYDRTPGGSTRCVSVPPAGASVETEAEFEEHSANYLGASADGSAVAFELGHTMYAGIGNEETVEVATGATAFGGISRDGSRVFYLAEPSKEGIPRGEIFACDLGSGPCAGEGAHPPIQIGSGGESTLVNVSPDGSHVYFVSPKVLDEADEGVLGKDNLYLWDGSSPRFIAVLDPLDVSGETIEGHVFGGLGQWVSDAVGQAPSRETGPGNDPSRTTPDGRVLVFQSHADLTPSYQSDGRSEVYRYDSEAEPAERLLCVSCNPTGAPGASNAELQSPVGPLLSSVPPVDPLVHIANVTADGGAVFFQSADRLVSADRDGKVDVYEWEAAGSGACGRPGGCLYLISSGKSSEDDYLYSVTPDGSNVFFESGDTLVSQDPDKTPSIYDARVDGGFPASSPPPGECLGEACQPAALAPDEQTPASSSFQGAGNLSEGGASKPRCSKGKRRVASKGRSRCVKSHKKHRANANRRRAR
jgi:hypothetical protein